VDHLLRRDLQGFCHFYLRDCLYVDSAAATVHLRPFDRQGTSGQAPAGPRRCCRRRLLCMLLLFSSCRSCQRC
jgi:hypothetical protein